MARKSPAKLREQQRRRNIARERERHRMAHYGEPQERRCECGKVAASSEKEAVALALHYFVRKGGRAPQRVYECSVVSGVFHWTSQR